MILAIGPEWFDQRSTFLGDLPPECFRVAALSGDLLAEGLDARDSDMGPSTLSAENAHSTAVSFPESARIWKFVLPGSQY